MKDDVQHRRGLPIMPSDTEAVRHPKSYVDCKESIPDAIDNKVLPKYNAYSVKRDCTYGELPGGHDYDCHSCLKRFTDNQLTGSGPHGRGGVFVPTSKTSAGSLAGATGVFVDFERYTPYARGTDGVEDPAALAEYENFFGVGAAARRQPPQAERRGIAERAIMAMERDCSEYLLPRHVLQVPTRH